MELPKQKAALIRGGYWLLAAVVTFLCVRYILPFLLPFLTGLLIAYLLRPVAGFLCRHSGIRRRSASIVAAVLFYLVLGGLSWLAVGWLSGWMQRAAAAFPGFCRESLVPLLDRLWRHLGGLGRLFLPRGTPRESQQLVDSVAPVLENIAGTISAWFMELAAKAAGGIPAAALSLLFTIISSVLICADYDRVIGFIGRQIPRRMHGTLLETRDFLLGAIGRLVRAYLILMVITFGVLSAGMWLLKIPNFWLIAAVIAVMDLLPVIGSGVVLVPWGTYSLASGQGGTGAGLLVLWAALSILREVLEPKIVGDQIGIHPLVALISMYVGLSAAGLGGLLILPVLCLLARHLQEKGILRLFR